MTTLDPRAPMVVDTRELGRRPGAMRSVERVVPAPADLGTEVIGVPEGDDLRLRLRLEAVAEGVLVSGAALTTATGECVRCLDPVRQSVEVTFQELFVYPDGRSRQTTSSDDDEDDLPELDGDLVDVEPLVRDAVVLALPFQPVCDPDCPGLCGRCGQRLADDPQHTHEDVDPRWSALQGLLTREDSPGPEKES